MDPSNEDEEAKLETENNLIDIAHWAILSMKVPGYLFFTTTKTNHVFHNPPPLFVTKVPENPIKLLNFLSTPHKNPNNQFPPIPQSSSQPLKTFSPLNFKSLFQLNPYTIYICLCFISSVFLTLFGFYKGYEVLLQFGDAAGRDNFQLFSEVSDQFLATYNIISTIVFLLTFRIIFCFKNSETMKFWSDTVNLYHEFRRTSSQSGTEMFQNIRRELAADAVWHWTIVLAQSGCVTVTVLYMNYFLARRFLDVGILTMVLSVFCLTVINCHVGLTIWLGFFIRFYSTCFKSVRENIAELSKAKASSLSMQITLQNGQFEFNSPKLHESLEKQMDLYEEVYENVEKFNKFYVLALMVDMFIGLSNALATVYQINRVTYESGSVAWELLAHIGMKIPQHFLYVLRLFYLINRSDDLSQEGVGVLRSLQRVKAALLVNNGSGAGLLAKMQILVTRVSLNPPSVAPGNYFRMSRRLLASIVSILATYFIILTELREEEGGRSLIRSLLNNSCNTGVFGHSKQ